MGSILLSPYPHGVNGRLDVDNELESLIHRERVEWTTRFVGAENLSGSMSCFCKCTFSRRITCELLRLRPLDSFGAGVASGPRVERWEPALLIVAGGFAPLRMAGVSTAGDCTTGDRSELCETFRWRYSRFNGILDATGEGHLLPSARDGDAVSRKRRCVPLAEVGREGPRVGDDWRELEQLASRDITHTCRESGASVVRGGKINGDGRRPRSEPLSSPWISCRRVMLAVLPLRWALLVVKFNNLLK